jgi:hypothetical protein
MREKYRSGADGVRRKFQNLFENAAVLKTGHRKMVQANRPGTL